MHRRQLITGGASLALACSGNAMLDIGEARQGCSRRRKRGVTGFSLRNPASWSPSQMREALLVEMSCPNPPAFYQSYLTQWWGVTDYHYPTPNIALDPIPGLELHAYVEDAAHCTADQIARVHSANATMLAGFAEPDHIRQSSMWVGTEPGAVPKNSALNLWPLLLDTGLELGSPATTGYPLNAIPGQWAGGDVTTDDGWLQQFMAGCKAKGYRVDFIRVDWYGNLGSSSPKQEGDKLISYIRRTHEKYDLPVWLGETGLYQGYAGPFAFESQRIEYVQHIAPQLEELECLKGWALWTMYHPDRGGTNESRLFSHDGTLTGYGEAINQLP